jgi:hypothetical protein
VAVGVFRDEPSLAAGRVSGRHLILVIHMGGQPATSSHGRIRADRIDSDGKPTLRYNGNLHHIGRIHARTRVLMLVHDLEARVINAATGELLRELTLDPERNYQLTGHPPRSPPSTPRKRKSPEP